MTYLNPISLFLCNPERLAPDWPALVEFKEFVDSRAYKGEASAPLKAVPLRASRKRPLECPQAYGSVMAELDYMFLADFARVEPAGTLTAIGASWTVLQAPSFPAMHMLAVAGRVRTKVGDEVVEGRILITGPEDSVNINLALKLQPDGNARAYGDGRIGNLFAVNLPVPIVRAGLYWVRLELDGTVRRSLAFEAVVSGA